MYNTNVRSLTLYNKCDTGLVRSQSIRRVNSHLSVPLIYNYNTIISTTHPLLSIA